MRSRRTRERERERERERVSAKIGHTELPHTYVRTYMYVSLPGAKRKEGREWVKNLVCHVNLCVRSPILLARQRVWLYNSTLCMQIEPLRKIVHMHD